MSTPPPRPPFTFVIVAEPSSTMASTLDMSLRQIEFVLNTLEGKPCNCGKVHDASEDPRLMPEFLAPALKNYIDGARFDTYVKKLEELRDGSDDDRARNGFPDKAHVNVMHLRLVKVLAWKPPAVELVH